MVSRVIKHPSADLARARELARDGSFESGARSVVIALESDGAFPDHLKNILENTAALSPLASLSMTNEEKARRTADAMQNSFGDDWDVILDKARELAVSASNSEFAEAVLDELEKRYASYLNI